MLTQPEITRPHFQQPRNEQNWIYLLQVRHTDQQEPGVQATDVEAPIKSAEHTVVQPEIDLMVKQALKLNPYIDSSRIRVQSQGSRVTLSGKVKSWFQKEEAARVAKLASGNLNIINDIAISYYA